MQNRGGESRFAMRCATVDLRLGFRQGQTMTVAVTPVADDTALVRAAQQGDRAAFGQLYQRYSRMVHGILLARIGPPDAEDLVHEVFLVALRRLHTLREAGAFGGWLAMIARNRATDHFRRARENCELPDSLAARNVPHAEARAALEKIRELPEAYREPLILRLVEGMTGPEIAARTGLTPASVRVNLHRGMKMLREKLGLTPRPGDEVEA
jgi:RNA polymerase sigma-70 factor (ECF subfamily)